MPDKLTTAPGQGGDVIKRFVDLGDTSFAELILSGRDAYVFLPGDAELEVSAAVAAAANNQTLAAAAGKRTYITGFSVTGGGATAASIIAITVTGLTTTLTYHLGIPAGAAVGVAPLVVEFGRPIPASADNTAIVVNVPSFGAGNTAASATARGFQR